MRACALAVLTVLLTFGLAACDSTDDPLPGRPELIGPDDSTRFDTEAPIELKWFGERHAASYRVEVSRTPDFSELAAEEETGSTFITVGPFPKGTYYWRVIPRALGGAEGRSSGDHLFIVEDQRNAAGTLSWTYGVDLSTTGSQVQVVSSGNGGLPRLLADNGLPPTTVVREVTFNAVTLQQIEPEAVTLRQVGDTYRFLAERGADDFRVIATLDTAPSSAGATLVVLQPSVLELNGPLTTALRFTPSADAPESSVFEATAQVQMLVVVP